MLVAVCVGLGAGAGDGSGTEAEWVVPAGPTALSSLACRDLAPCGPQAVSAGPARHLRRDAAADLWSLVLSREAEETGTSRAASAVPSLRQGSSPERASPGAALAAGPRGAARFTAHRTDLPPPIPG